jgi:hypothetical protein
MDVRYWVEMYRALPSVIRDMLWNEGGVFDRGFVPPGPTISVDEAKTPQQETLCCDGRCDARTTVITDRTIVITDGTEDTDTVDVRTMLDHSSGKKTYVRLERTPIESPRQQPNLYTPISEQCDELKVMISAHPQLMKDAHEGMRFLLQSLHMKLPADEIAKVVRVQCKRKGQQQQLVDLSVPPKRSHRFSNDKRGGE